MTVKPNTLIGKHNIKMLEAAGLGNNTEVLRGFNDDFRGKIIKVHLFGPEETPYCVIEVVKDREGKTGPGFYTLRTQLIAGKYHVVIIDTRVHDTFEHALAFCIAPGFDEAISTLIDNATPAVIDTRIMHNQKRFDDDDIELVAPITYPVKER